MNTSNGVKCNDEFLLFQLTPFLCHSDVVNSEYPDDSRGELCITPNLIDLSEFPLRSRCDLMA